MAMKFLGWKPHVWGNYVWQMMPSEEELKENPVVKLTPKWDERLDLIFPLIVNNYEYFEYSKLANGNYYVNIESYVEMGESLPLVMCQAILKKENIKIDYNSYWITQQEYESVFKDG